MSVGAPTQHRHGGKKSIGIKVIIDGTKEHYAASPVFTGFVLFLPLRNIMEHYRTLGLTDPN